MEKLLYLKVKLFNTKVLIEDTSPYEDGTAIIITITIIIIIIIIIPKNNNLHHFHCHHLHILRVKELSFTTLVQSYLPDILQNRPVRLHLRSYIAKKEILCCPF